MLLTINLNMKAYNQCAYKNISYKGGQLLLKSKENHAKIT